MPSYAGAVVLAGASGLFFGKTRSRHLGRVLGVDGGRVYLREMVTRGNVEGLPPEPVCLHEEGLKLLISFVRR